jgi:hypothetical protein
VLFEQVRQLQQRRCARPRRRVAPARERGRGGGHGAVDIGLRPLRYLGDDVAGRRIDDLANAAVDCLHELTCDEVALRVLGDAHGLGSLR